MSSYGVASNPGRVDIDQAEHDRRSAVTDLQVLIEQLSLPGPAGQRPASPNNPGSSLRNRARDGTPHLAGTPAV